MKRLTVLVIPLFLFLLGGLLPAQQGSSETGVREIRMTARKYRFDPQEIRVREGDALEIIPQLQGPFDFVFIDAWKRDYIRYFRLVYPKIRPGGANFAHNVLSHGKELRDFLTAIGNHPSLDTHIDRRSRAGLSVSIKRQ